MTPRPGRAGHSSAWTPGRPADYDAETARILASYPPNLFQPDDLAIVLGKKDRDAAEKRMGLELLARAHIKTVPDCFSSSYLLAHIRDWKRELREWEIGPQPPAAERDALEAVVSAAKRLTLALNRLTYQMDQAGSRIASSTFASYWDRARLDQLRCELDDLRGMAGSDEVKETMRREDRPLKQEGGWSAREALYGDNIPKLYGSIFGRRFTASGKTGIFPSEGVRFACVIATVVLGYTVLPETVVKQRTRYRAARGGKHGQK